MADEHKDNIIELYKSKAHVFQINDTRDAWEELGLDAVKRAEREKRKEPNPSISISFVYSSIPNVESPYPKRELKIIAIGENGDKVLDTTILTKTNFQKRTGKFGQWVDHEDNVYGVGFGSESELIEFIETFQKLQRDHLSESPSSHHQQPLHHPDNLQSQTVSQNDRSGWNQQNLNNVSETNGRFQANKPSRNTMQQSSNTLAHPGHQQQQLKRQQQGQINPGNGNTSLNNNNSGGSNDNLNGYPRSQSMVGLQTKANSSINSNSKWSELANSSVSMTESQVVEQLKYENERLKQALEDGSKNAGVWHTELLNLRTNNVKLTEALQSSKANVLAWQDQLLSLREENKELKLRVLALESANDSEEGNEVKNDLQKYKNYVDGVQKQLRQKEIEIDELQKSMEELELKAQSSIQNGQMNDSQNNLSSNQKRELEVISAKFESKVRGLADVQKELELLLHSVGQ